MIKKKESDPLVDSVTFALAASLARSGELKQAEALIFPLTRKTEPEAEPLDLLAKIYAQQGRIDEAQALWLIALERKPSDIHILKALQTCADIKHKGDSSFAGKNAITITMIICFNIVLVIALAVLAVLGMMMK